jgi:hypothetical protein
MISGLFLQSDKQTPGAQGRGAHGVEHGQRAPDRRSAQRSVLSIVMGGEGRAIPMRTTRRVQCLSVYSGDRAFESIFDIPSACSVRRCAVWLSRAWRILEPFAPGADYSPSLTTTTWGRASRIKRIRHAGVSGAAEMYGVESYALIQPRHRPVMRDAGEWEQRPLAHVCLARVRRRAGACFYSLPCLRATAQACSGWPIPSPTSVANALACVALGPPCWASAASGAP